jgi:hypothetical protein
MRYPCGGMDASWGTSLMEDLASRSGTRVRIATESYEVGAPAIDGAFAMEVDWDARISHLVAGTPNFPKTVNFSQICRSGSRYRSHIASFPRSRERPLGDGGPLCVGRQSYPAEPYFACEFKLTRRRTLGKLAAQFDETV